MMMIINITIIIIKSLLLVLLFLLFSLLLLVDLISGFSAPGGRRPRGRARGGGDRPHGSRARRLSDLYSYVILGTVTLNMNMNIWYIYGVYQCRELFILIQSINVYFILRVTVLFGFQSRGRSRQAACLCLPGSERFFCFGLFNQRPLGV